MARFHGDLLIGGMTLRHLHVDLEQDRRKRGSKDRLLAGRFEVDDGQQGLIQVGRPYRLQLEDGRAGQIIVSEIDPGGEPVLLVRFEPQRQAMVQTSAAQPQ